MIRTRGFLAFLRCVLYVVEVSQYWVVSRRDAILDPPDGSSLVRALAPPTTSAVKDFNPSGELMEGNP